jgi:hypothetical protein
MMCSSDICDCFVTMLYKGSKIARDKLAGCRHGHRGPLPRLCHSVDGRSLLGPSQC